jgi:hypothetical protein
MSVPMPLLVFFFAVTMGVNHQKRKDDCAANRQNDDDGLISPYLADKVGHVWIHVGL